MGMMPFGWLRALGTIGTVLTLIVLLVGFILSLTAYLKRGRSRVGLLGTVGFLLMLLLACCSFTWGLADRPILRELPSRTEATYYVAKNIVLFLLGLLNLVGIALLISAIWKGSSEE
jgi:hypothetical protein